MRGRTTLPLPFLVALLDPGRVVPAATKGTAFRASGRLRSVGLNVSIALDGEGQAMSESPSRGPRPRW